MRRQVGARVQWERRRLKLSQEELAERLGFSPNYIAHLERGSRGLSLATAVRLALGLQIPLPALFEAPRRAAVSGARGRKPTSPA